VREEARVIVIGAVLGALVGAAGGWAYRRYGPPARSGGTNLPAKAGSVDRGQLFRLALAVLAVLRQVSELR